MYSRAPAKPDPSGENIPSVRTRSIIKRRRLNAVIRAPLDETPLQRRPRQWSRWRNHRGRAAPGGRGRPTSGSHATGDNRRNQLGFNCSPRTTEVSREATTSADLLVADGPDSGRPHTYTRSQRRARDSRPPRAGDPYPIRSRFSNSQIAVVTRPSSNRSDSSMSRRKGAENRRRRKIRSRSCETSQVSRTSVPSSAGSNS